MSLDISIVIPLFNEEESLRELHSWICRSIEPMNKSFEMIFVDDGSKDNSWKIVEELSEKDDRVKGIRFRRNYGKSAALNEGFHATSGDVVITMDADLQDSPEEVPGLYKMIMEDGYDLVSGWKKKRFDPALTKRVPSKLYNYTTGVITGIKLHDMNCGLKAYKGDVVHSIEVYGEMHRYIPVIARRAGFGNIGEKVVQHQERKYGVTKFGLERFVFGFLDLLSITFVTRFGKSPMHLFGTIGALSFFLGGGVTIYLIAEKLYRIASKTVARDVVDQPLFYLALVAVVAGVQLFLAGFLGELISRNSPDRNTYLVSKRLRLND